MALRLSNKRNKKREKKEKGKATTDFFDYFFSIPYVARLADCQSTDFEVTHLTAYRYLI